MTAGPFLVFLETSGNQSYIYATNKLRENLGASELTYQCGTAWVLEAAGFDEKVWKSAGNPPEFRAQLAKIGFRSRDVEVVLATSGKAMLVADSHERAKSIVHGVTLKAAQCAPGLTVTGAIVALGDRRNPASVNEAIKEAHHRFNNHQSQIAAGMQRAPMGPFVEPCSTTGTPAATFDKNDRPISAASKAKRDAAGAWFQRIKHILRSDEGSVGLRITESVDELENSIDELSWISVIFADGNGLGQIMMRFSEWLGRLPKSVCTQALVDGKHDYLAMLREFSRELDYCCEQAFLGACRLLARKGAFTTKKGGYTLPVVPLLLGGDDLTAIVDGNFALQFTKCYLDAYEDASGSANCPTISAIAGVALGAPRLSTAAGVAIVKKHFPFHSAHDLAAGLLQSAKTVKKQVLQDGKSEAYPCSSLDFHVLLDAAYSSLDNLRKTHRTVEVDNKTHKLWGGPYATTRFDLLDEASDASKEWAKNHALNELLRRIDALQAREDGRLKLPSSVMHALREALAGGKGVADAKLAEYPKLQKAGLTKLLESDESLFREQNGSQSAYTTRFVDALTASSFWEVDLRVDFGTPQTAEYGEQQP